MLYGTQNRPSPHYIHLPWNFDWSIFHTTVIAVYLIVADQPPSPASLKTLLYRYLEFDILTSFPLDSGEAWRTALLTDRVQEQVGTGASKVDLIAMASAADSTSFWMSRLKGLLKLPKMPTGPQVCATYCGCIGTEN